MVGNSQGLIDNAGASQKIMMRSEIMHAACRADGNAHLIPMVPGDSPTRKMAGESVVGVRTPSANPRVVGGGGVETLFLGSLSRVSILGNAQVNAGPVS